VTPDINEARAIARYVHEEYGDAWTHYLLGRYAFHTGLPVAANPYDSSDGWWWSRGWLREARRPDEAMGDITAKSDT